MRRRIIFGLSCLFSLALFTKSYAAEWIPRFEARRPSYLLARSGPAYLQALTGDDSDADKVRWDSIYRKHKGYVFGTQPVRFLVDNVALLPPGRVLDVAMGEGRNAVYLASKRFGNRFSVEGVDISPVAILKANRLAQDAGVRIKTITADLNTYKIAKNSYDVILVFYYLQRSLIPQIVEGLRPGGVVLYETHTIDQLMYDRKASREYLLEKDELKRLFKDLEIVKYQERRIGNGGNEAVASLVARKPKK